MKLSVQYLNDSNGNPLSVQLPFLEWKNLLTQLNSYEQLIKVKNDLKEAFEQVQKMRAGKIKKQSLSDFLNDI